MAIRQRIGLEPDFRPAKMLPGELAISTDTGKAWYCWATNKVKVFATKEDLQDIINASGSEYEKLQELIEYLKQNPDAYDQIIKNITNLHESKQDKLIGTSTASTHSLPTSEGAAVIRELPGVTEQVVTTGAQLIDFRNAVVSNGVLIDEATGSYRSNIIDSYYIEISLTKDIIIKLNENLGKKMILQCKKGISDACISATFFGSRTNGESYKEESSINGERYIEFTLANDFTTITDVSVRFNRKGVRHSDTTSICSEIMLYFADTGEKSFEPYTGGKPAPNPDYTQRVQGVGDSGWFDGKLLQGAYTQNTGEFVSGTRYTCGANFITCKPDDVITIKYEEYTEYLSLQFFAEDKTFVGALASDKIAKTFSVKAPAGASYFHFSIQCESGKEILINQAKHIIILKNGKYAVQVISYDEENPTSKSTAYIELDHPLYTGDKIYLEDGYLWEYRENGVVEYDGSADEVWNVFQYTNLCAYIKLPGIKVETKRQYCDLFEVLDHMSDKKNGTTGVAIEGISSGVYGTFFGINGLATNIASWMDWLKSHPVKFIFQLITPTRTRLNQPAAYGLRTYGEQTRIYIPDDLEPEFSVDYPLNPAGGYALDGFCQARANEAKEEINRQALDDRIAKIEVDLGANTFIVE